LKQAPYNSSNFNMRVVFALSLIGLVCAGELSVFNHGKKNHYHEIKRLIKPSMDQQDSVRLTEIETHVGVQNPMITIYQTCEVMHAEAIAERKKLVKDNQEDRTYCQKELTRFAEKIRAGREIEATKQIGIAKEREIANKLWEGQSGPQRKIFSTNYAQLWVHYKSVFPGSVQEKAQTSTTQEAPTTWSQYIGERLTDFKIHSQYLIDRKAFEHSISQMRLLYRVLNGEGSLNDLSGHHNTNGYAGNRHGFISELAQHQHVKSVPFAVSMLQVFSKTVAKMESKMQNPTPADMDAINVVIAKIQKALKAALDNLDESEDSRQNLEQDLLSNMEGEVSSSLKSQLDAMWGTPQERSFGALSVGSLPESSLKQNFYTSYINLIACNSDGGESNDQCSEDEGAANHWNLMSRLEIEMYRVMKERTRREILHEFLVARCGRSRRATAVAFTTLANEINALSNVMQYLEKCCVEKSKEAGKVYKSKYGKEMDAIMSTPYQWEVQPSPVYTAVKNTFSTVDNDNDKISCATMYSTVFSAVRILTLKQTKEAVENKKPKEFYLEPNDLKHSTNFRTDLKTKFTTGIQCKLFPSGIPVGRAHSCSKTASTQARIDLSGTPYRFMKSGAKFFKVAGRETNEKATGANMAVKLSDDQRTIYLQVTGRCGDVYGDDSPNADYRSDPIPLELAPGAPTNAAVVTAAPAVATAAPAAGPAGGR